MTQTFRPQYGGKYWLGQSGKSQIYAIYFGMSDGSHIFMCESKRGEVQVFEFPVTENGECPREYFSESLPPWKNISDVDLSFPKKLEDLLERNFALGLIRKHMSRYGVDAVENPKEMELALEVIREHEEASKKKG